MVFYPEDGEGKLQEVWHGEKMLRDVPDDVLTPTLRFNGTIYWVDELVKRSKNRWFIPKRWITHRGRPHAVGYHVIESEVC